MQADIDCSSSQFPAKFAVAADFDKDGRAELVVAPEVGGTRGNDLWVMKYVGDFPTGAWEHMAPIPGQQNQQMQADIDCSSSQFPAKFAVVADFDKDGRAELVVAPEVGGTRGNDLWVMKYVGDFPTGAWEHMALIPGQQNQQMQADIDCSSSQFPAKFAVVADFDKDGRAELVVAPEVGGTRGNDLWVMKYVGDFPTGAWEHMAPIPGQQNQQMQADTDCSSSQFPAKFAVVADFDKDGRAELVVAPEVGGTRGNDLWVMKYVGDFPTGAWGAHGPHPGSAEPTDAGGYRLLLGSSRPSSRWSPTSTVMVPMNLSSRPMSEEQKATILWVMKYFGAFPSGDSTT